MKNSLAFILAICTPQNSLARRIYLFISPSATSIIVMMTNGYFAENHQMTKKIFKAI